MRILIAPDSFKDALAAPGVASAIAKGLREASAQLEPVLLPLADGGEGTARVLCAALDGKWVEAKVLNPLLRPVNAGYAWIPAQRLAVIELAQAAGLSLLNASERNPLHTSTFGLGMLMQHALQHGAKELLLTLGGSATNDCGIGMLAAMGFQFFAKDGIIDKPTGGDLGKVLKVVAPHSLPKFTCTVLSDVRNPLLGPKGAARTFAPQKGATPEIVDRLEIAAASFAKLVEAQMGRNQAEVPGMGAAGGTGFGACTYLDAQIKSGTDEILRITNFEDLLSTCDVVIGGEGCFDSQTVDGKLISGIAARAYKMQIPCFVICGSITATRIQQEALGITAAFTLGNGARPLSESLGSTAADLERVAYQLGRTIMVLK